MALNPNDLRLYLVTDPILCAEHGVIGTVAAAVAGGVTFVQLRDKTASTADRVALAGALKDALAGTGVPFVINDDVTAAKAADVDGVHVGQDDMAAAEARAILGPGKIVGLSCESAAAVSAVDPRIVDYLGIGTVFATATKADHKPTIGMDGLAALCALAPVPTVAIGGLKATHARDAQMSGADGMAVVSAICGQPDPEKAAKEINQAMGDLR
ncbi:thiamine phosphate synthase [Cognatiyoonia sp. IB215182]|uniref:thiamine phosphate synthase n=1 Tax=Cognatiyoonia sp. IB215182 TaxID=3097353 RepID=UPI002A118828|nr:thiamine phosphate synthase [Cognatiyoonia sp. IB215182]MDX8351818.1 thiamine phosphate synthase [Cognatiyoonia sp. IB215182]